MAISISYPIHVHFLYQPETPIFAQGSKAQRLIYWWRVDIGYNRQMRREIINCIHLFFFGQNVSTRDQNDLSETRLVGCDTLHPGIYMQPPK